LRARGNNASTRRGRGRHPIERVPYGVDHAVRAFAGIRQVILIGALKPVIFFAYPNKPGSPVPADALVHVMSRPEHDQAQALAALADALGAPQVAPPDHAPAEPARGQPSSDAFARSLAALLPENAVVAEEAVTFGRSFFPATHGAAPHDWLNVTGGAIGGGMPMATGAAVGAPGRRVVNLQADGSGMYTLQALWTQAREKLDVTTVIFANRKYAILLHELANVGANPGRTALDMLDLGNPDLDWVALAAGMGVDGAKAETMEQFNDLFTASLKRKGPFVIELVI
jgi:acetolactate synthase I/II/III large subunit